MAESITPEMLADMEEPHEVAISPNGKVVVYSLQKAGSYVKEHKTSSLWIADVGEEFSARQLTSGAYRDVGAKFSPDGSQIAFLSDRAKAGTGPGLYVMPLAGGEALPLTSTEDEMEISTFSWSPDGRKIAYARPDEKSKERKKKEEDKDDVKVEGENIDYARLRVIDVQSKECKTLANGNVHVAQITWSPDGSKIVYCTTQTPGLNDFFSNANNLYIVDVDKESTKHLLTYATWIQDLCWVDTEDAACGTIMWRSTCDEHNPVDCEGIWSTSADDGSQRSSSTMFGNTDTPSGLRYRQNTVAISVQAGVRDQIHIMGSGKIHDEPYKLVAWDVCPQKEDTILAFVKGTTGEPSQVFSKVKGKICQLSQHNKKITEKKAGTTAFFEYTTSDGFTVDAMYSIPTHLQESFKSRKPSPTIVYPHGGPYGRESDGFDDCGYLGAWMMACGYLVMFPNYRGGSARGSAFAKTVHHNVAASHQDVIFMTKKGIEAGLIDKDRVSIMGWSQGGFLSYFAVTQPQDFIYKSAIPCAGVSDWDLMAETSDIEGIEAALGGGAPWYDSTPDNIVARKGSAVYHMGDHIQTPVLIIHGEADERVPVPQARAFYRGMKHLGTDCEMAIYPRENHGPPWERLHYLDMLRRMKVFLHKHMG